MKLPASPPLVPPRWLDPTRFQYEPAQGDRTGGCTLGCGACCEALILPIHPGVLTSPRFEDWRKWVELHGIVLFSRVEGSLSAHIPIACTALTEDKLCSLHGTKEKPEMCLRYPKTSEDLVSVEHICTYKFRAEGG